MRKQITILAITALLLVPSTAAFAGWEEGVAALKAKNYETAAKEFKTVVNQQPEWAPGQRMLGQVLIKLKRTDEALTHLRKAYDLAPGDVTTQFALGQAYVEARRYADGASVLGKMNRDALPAAQRGTLDQLMAVALSKSGQADAALSALARAASASPNDANVQYQYGVAALNGGDLSKAVGALRKAVSLGANTDNQKALTQALLQQGRRSRGSAKAEAYRQATSTAQALVASSGSFDNLMMLAGAALGAQQFDTALSAAQRASRANSGDWLPLYYLGQAYTQKGQFSSAETELRKALNAASSSSDKNTIWGQLGYVYEKTKSYDEAIAAYNQAGNSSAATRVRDNKETASYNTNVEKENQEIQDLEREARELEKALSELPGGSDPPLFN